MDNQSTDSFWQESSGTQPGYGGFPDKSQVLDFQTFDQSTTFYTPGMYQPGQYMQPYPLHTINSTLPYEQSVPGQSAHIGESEFDEAPLLDELEIYPQRILQKSLAVLNPFHATSFKDTTDYLFKESDLAGPILLLLVLAACLSISNSKAQFGYIYGLSAISVVVMYCLIYLMGHLVESFVSISGIASVLGYSMLPIVCLSIVSVMIPLNNFYGVVITGAAIALASMNSSKMFCLMTGDPHQRYLLAYPCALLYAIFSLLVLF
ncbi:protein YIPF5 homolog [Anopheles bellator]|uniref:protein YIPF5 homolog n=1 Tax=Anopheles bellator TaxID=139047 RepID=UPI0026471897|nr:protein YIPF5 homolog [Anopheles bellator]